MKGYKEYNRDIVLRDGIEDMGSYKVRLPERPPYEDFINYGKPIEEQFFVKEIIPSWVWKLDQKSKLKDKRDEVMDICRNNDEYYSFICDQWRKRNEGIWIFIYGIPTYITGYYWWFLNYYIHEGNEMEFRFVDLEHSYWFEYCVRGDKNMFGGVEMTMRRDGKSCRMGAMVLEEVTRQKFFNIGVQSKDEPSAKEFFSKCIMLPFQRLPFYYRPLTDSRQTAPTALHFRNALDLNLGLNNWVHAKPTTETAFDGTKLGFYILEEPGKTENMSVDRAVKIHVQCLQIRGKKVGHALLSTTVEETNRNGLVEFQKIWDKSDHRKLMQNGKTQSGLCRYYKSSYETYRIDQYGISVVDKPLPHQQKYFEDNGYLEPEKGGKQLVDDMIDSATAEDRQDLIRKYSRNIREAFRRDSKDCMFDIVDLDKQLDRYRFKDEGIIGGNRDLICGNLNWKNGVVDTEVVFTECENGRFLFNRYIFPFIENVSNNVDWSMGIPKPMNKHLGCLGADPYKYDKTEGDKKSLGTIVGYCGLNLGMEEKWIEEGGEGLVSDNFFVEYGYRHKDKVLYGEDLIMLCHFTGMEVFPEINVTFVVDYLKTRGYTKFLKFRKTFKKVDGRYISVLGVNAGMQTLGDSIKVALFDNVSQYLVKSVNRCYFPNMLNNFRDVQYSDLSPYDYFVGAAFALYAYNNSNVIHKQREKVGQSKNYANPLVGI